MEYNGTQKIAILLLALGDKFASDVFKRMERNEITSISKVIMELDSVSKEDVEAILREFHVALVDGLDVVSGGQDVLKQVLAANLDAETAKYISDALNIETGPMPFQELDRANPKLLAQLLRNEHPQTLALILGHLQPEQAANLLLLLPPPVRPEILMRLAKLEAVPEEMLLDVDKVLQSQLIAMGSKEGKKVGGNTSVAEILNQVDRATEEEVLSEIEETSVQMAEDIRNLMFVFEDCRFIDDKGMRELLKETSNDDLTLALKGASEELKEIIFRNMSERASEMIKEELEYMGPTKLSDVESAQQAVVKLVRKLESQGKLIISRGSGGEVFV